MTTPAQSDPMVKGWAVGLHGSGSWYLTRDPRIVDEERAEAIANECEGDLIIEEVEGSRIWWEYFEANAPEFGGW